MTDCTLAGINMEMIKVQKLVNKPNPDSNSMADY